MIINPDWTNNIKDRIRNNVVYFQDHLKKPPNSCFTSNWFKSALLAWEGNIDIPPVINQYI